MGSIFTMYGFVLRCVSAFLAFMLQSSRFHSLWLYKRPVYPNLEPDSDPEGYGFVQVQAERMGDSAE